MFLYSSSLQSVKDMTHVRYSFRSHRCCHAEPAQLPPRQTCRPQAPGSRRDRPDHRCMGAVQDNETFNRVMQAICAAASEKNRKLIQAEYPLRAIEPPA